MAVAGVVPQPGDRASDVRIDLFCSVLQSVEPQIRRFCPGGVAEESQAGFRGAWLLCQVERGKDFGRRVSTVRNEQNTVPDSLDFHRSHLFASAVANRGAAATEQEIHIAPQCRSQLLECCRRQMEVPQAIEHQQRRCRVTGAAAEAGLSGNPFANLNGGSAPATGMLLEGSGGPRDEIGFSQWKVQGTGVFLPGSLTKWAAESAEREFDDTIGSIGETEGVGEAGASHHRFQLMVSVGSPFGDLQEQVDFSRGLGDEAFGVIGVRAGQITLLLNRGMRGGRGRVSRVGRPKLNRWSAGMSC